MRIMTGKVYNTLLYIGIILLVLLILYIVYGCDKNIPIVEATIIESDCSSVPSKSLPFLPILKEEHKKIWPDSKIIIYAGQIEQESSWRETIISKDKGMGLGQFMSPTIKDIQKKYGDILGEMKPLKALWSIRALLLYSKDLDKLCNFAYSDEDRQAFRLGAYNGGFGFLMKDRKLTEQMGKNKNKWYCNVEHYSNRAEWAFKVNREYPIKIPQRAEKYRECLNG